MLLIDKDHIYIKNYKELLVMEDMFFRIKMEGYLLNIRGSHFEMTYYDQNEIRITGHVKVIEYDENRV